MLDRMLAGRTGLSPVMVGRTSPLSRLTGLMATSAREPAVALVVGEAGVGKTRLLRELVRSLLPEVQVLAGQAEPGSLGRPFELALDALGLDAVPDTPDRLAAVVQAYLDRVASGPAVIIFEDLHWADAESLGVFERLASGTPLGTMLIGSYRPDELSPLPPCGRSARAARAAAHRAPPAARPARPSRRSRTSSHASTGDRCRRRRPTRSTRAPAATRSSSRRS